MKRSLSNFWHPNGVFESLNKGAFVDWQLCTKAAGNNVLNGALRGRIQSSTRSLQSRRCYLWAEKLDKMPLKQEYLCAWNLSSSTLVVQLYPSQRLGHAEQGGNTRRERRAGVGRAGEQPGAAPATAGPPGVQDPWKIGHRKPSSRVMKHVSSLRKTLVIVRGNYRQYSSEFCHQSFNMKMQLMPFYYIPPVVFKVSGTFSSCISCLIIKVGVLSYQNRKTLGPLPYLNSSSTNSFLLHVFLVLIFKAPFVYGPFFPLVFCFLRPPLAKMTLLHIF